METLADRINKKMNELGIDQYMLAKKIGISQPSVSAICSGETKNPRKILEIATALGTTPFYLQSGKQTNTGFQPVIDSDEWFSLSAQTREFISDIISCSKSQLIADDFIRLLQKNLEIVTQHRNHAHA